jgi:hypothetical protein
MPWERTECGGVPRRIDVETMSSWRRRMRDLESFLKGVQPYLDDALWEVGAPKLERMPLLRDIELFENLVGKGIGGGAGDFIKRVHAALEEHLSIQLKIVEHNYFFFE